jgi:hypothetical protein
MKIQFGVVAVTLLSAAVFAQQSTGNLSDGRFAVLDADQSDGISAEEAEASPAVMQSFSRVDANRDGILTREEFHAAFRVRQLDPETAPRSPPPPK